MDQWLEWARGPLFRFALAVMLLGLFRLVAINVIGLVSLTRRARDKQIPTSTVLRDTTRWLFPFNRVPKHQLFFTAVSVVFHVCIIVVPIFLGAHIVLWERGFGVSWVALDQSWADVLTVVAIITAVILFARRVSTPLTRSLSRAQDYILPLLIANCFVTGFLAMHPAWNPFSYDPTMLVHVLSSNLLMITIPFSKLSHMILFPITQLVSEMGWHLAPTGGHEVALALGKEAEPV
jgi:nitrate reductase gamma subunit